MADIRFTANAAADLTEIAAYTVKTFGPQQEQRYRSGFKALFERLADEPNSAPVFEGAPSGARRARFKSHSVYYRSTPSGILVLRILHAARDPAGLI